MTTSVCCLRRFYPIQHRDLRTYNYVPSGIRNNDLGVQRQYVSHIAGPMWSAVMNLGVLQKMENFEIRWVTVSFSRVVLLHGNSHLLTFQIINVFLCWQLIMFVYRIKNELVIFVTKVKTVILSHLHLSSQLQLQKYFILNSSIFWDIMPCSLLKVNRHFGRTCSWKRSIKVIKVSDISDCNSAFTLVSCSVYLTLKA
jgi:hypothetical protein